MTNIAYQDILGGSIHVYTAHKELPKNERIKKALDDLRHVGDVKIFLYKRRKMRLLTIKRK
jgi:hypothetical protein